jgi:hypothetical protein
MRDNEVLGEMGEKLVELYFKGDFKRSTDKYDMDGDGIFTDGQKGEVKTQAIFKWFRGTGMDKPEPAFTIPVVDHLGHEHTNQFRKCQEVDRLFFVSVPHDNRNNVEIWEAPNPDERRWFRKRNHNSEKVDQGILVSECNLLTTYTEPNIIKAFNKYSGNDDMDTWEKQYK